MLFLLRKLEMIQMLVNDEMLKKMKKTYFIQRKNVMIIF